MLTITPGIGSAYLISMYYTRYEIQWRMSIFFSASIVAGAVSGLLAFAIGKMDGVAGYSSWRWWVLTSEDKTDLLRTNATFSTGSSFWRAY